MARGILLLWALIIKLYVWMIFMQKVDLPSREQEKKKKKKMKMKKKSN